jgi:hypothetical protein
MNMEFNTYNKGYSSAKQFEHSGLYVTFGTCCGYGDNTRMATISIDKPELYVIGGEAFRSRLEANLRSKHSSERKRELFETEAYKLVAKELKDIVKLKALVEQIKDEAYRDGMAAARHEMRKALGLRQSDGYSFDDGEVQF